MIYRLSSEYYVRFLQESDVNGSYPDWFEDQEVCNYNSHGKFNKTKDYFLDYIKSLNNNKIVWAICHQDDGHIGNISLQDLSFIDRNAELAIIIGNKEHFGKGVGYLAASKILYHGFYKLNLKKIYCGTASSNVGMNNLAIKIGMKEEGRLKNHIYLNGNREDVVLYGIIKDE